MRRIVAGMMALLLSASAALAQASPPVEGSPPNTPGAGNARWLIVLVVVAALAIWYFARNRNRT